MKAICLMVMIFLHIIDDYVLQGVLAKLKQKKFWEENTSDDLYKHDYVIALLEHSFEWSFMIMLPFVILMICSQVYYEVLYVLVLLSNTAVHAIIDNLKANKLKINLWTDQVCHLLQIVVTWSVFIILTDLV